jgi:trigger factor
MESKVLKQTGLTTEIEVKVPANDIASVRAAELAKVGKTLALPGFRKGKVPAKVLEAKYGQAVMGDVLEAVVGQTSQQAIEQNKLRPALQPKVEVKSFDVGQDLVYVMTVENLPEVKVMDLKSIKLEKPVAKVADETINEALSRIAAQNGTVTDLEAPRASQNNDQLTIDFIGKTSEGVSLPGMSATDFALRLGSGSLIPGFEEQLVGKKVDETVDVKVTFPAQYHEASLAGKDAVFVTTIKMIQAFAPATIDDEFGKKLGFADLAGLKKAIEGQLGADYGRATRMKLKRALLDVLDENHTIDLPATMIDMEHQAIVQQMEAEARQRAQASGEHSHDDDHNRQHHSHLTDDEKAELREIAERRVRLGLVLAEVGKANNITVNEGELQRALFAEAGKYRGQEKMVLDYYRKNRQALESLRAPIFEEKVVDFILELAQVTEKTVSVEDLLKEDDDTVAGGAKAEKKTAKKTAKKKAE